MAGGAARARADREDRRQGASPRTSRSSASCAPRSASRGRVPATRRPLRAHVREAIDVDNSTVPAYLNLGDVHDRQGDRPGAVEAVGAPRRGGTRTAPISRSTVSNARIARRARRAASPSCASGSIARNPQDWRGAPGPRAPSREPPASHRAAFDLLLDALPHNPHGLAIHQEAWTILVAARFRDDPRPPLHGADARGGLLSRSARVPALPLSKHGAAVAVPAVPRVEHVRRGTNGAREGHSRGRGDDERDRDHAGLRARASGPRVVSGLRPAAEVSA